jgi:hypothetical protein
MAVSKTARTILGVATNLAAETEKTVTSITRSGVTATATTSAAHGKSNGDVVYIFGAAESEYNGVFTISNASGSVFDYTLKQDPGASASGTIKCWFGKLGTELDLSTALGVIITGRVQNGTTGPTAGLSILVGLANASVEADFKWRPFMTAGTGNLDEAPISWGLGAAVMFVNFFFYGNTGQAVDAEAFAHELTSV